MPKQKIEVELTNILLKEIKKYLTENEKRIDGSGMEIFGAVLSLLAILVAESNYEPEPMIEFIQDHFPAAVRNHRNHLNEIN